MTYLSYFIHYSDGAGYRKLFIISLMNFHVAKSDTLSLSIVHHFYNLFCQNIQVSTKYRVTPNHGEFMV